MSLSEELPERKLQYWGRSNRSSWRDLCRWATHGTNNDASEERDHAVIATTQSSATSGLSGCRVLYLFTSKALRRVASRRPPPRRSQSTKDLALLKMEVVLIEIPQRPGIVDKK